MTFKAFVYSIIKRKKSNTEIINLCSLALIIIGIFFIYIYNDIFLIDTGYGFLFLIVFCGFSAYIFNYFYQYYDFEKIKSKKKGFLEFDKDELIISYDEKIKYEEITHFDLEIDAYYNELINVGYRGPIEKRSLGISNSLTITHNSKTKKLNFKLENKSHLRVLERNLYEIIISEKLINIDSKKSIKLIPEQYQKFKEYESYIGKQLKARKINCTEGLLLIGYNSYDEAQDLKRKYCR